MSYKPSDAYYAEFTTQRFDTGAATDADSLPSATATKNGVDDGAFALTVANMDTGRYKITGTIPAGYAAGDRVQISVAATVNAVAGKAVVDAFAVRGKSIDDLSDPSAADVVAALFAKTGITAAGAVSFETILRCIYAFSKLNVVIDGEDVTFLDDDGLTELFTFTLSTAGRTLQ